MRKVYLDFAASTPVDDRVVHKMLPYFRQEFGNPSSIHYYGQEADAAIFESRSKVSSLMGAKPEMVIFTSGGTESDNLAMRGTVFRMREDHGANHLLISPVEHPAVIETARHLARHHGFELEMLPVDGFGRISPEDVRKRLRSDTAIVSVIYANNEIGTINPIEEIALICSEEGIPFHTDAVQAAAHLAIDIHKESIDLLSMGAHKFYGPKGVGALICRKPGRLQPQMTGGNQECGIRAGTQNVPLIVGLAHALEIARAERQARHDRLTPLRDHIIGNILEEFPAARLTGHPKDRLPNHASFVFQNVDGNLLLTQLDMMGFACSSGSACKVGTPKPSDILLATGIDQQWALGSLRITLGKDTTTEEVDSFLQALPTAVKKSRT